MNLAPRDRVFWAGWSIPAWHSVKRDSSCVIGLRDKQQQQQQLLFESSSSSLVVVVECAYFFDSFDSSIEWERLDRRWKSYSRTCPPVYHWVVVATVMHHWTRVSHSVVVVVMPYRHHHCHHHSVIAQMIMMMVIRHSTECNSFPFTMTFYVCFCWCCACFVVCLCHTRLHVVCLFPIFCCLFVCSRS